MNAREAAAKLAVLRAIKDQVDRAYAAARDDALAAMDPGDRKHAVLDDGTDIGTVSIARPRVKAHIHDERAFLRWVKDTRPDEIVETVRPSYRDHILKRCTDLGGVVDPDTGEIVADGVDVAAGDPYATCRQTDAQREAVARAHAAGALTEALRGTPLAELEEAK